MTALNTMSNNKIRLAGIVNDSITDGPGLRMTFFTQGCPHRCDGCHNPQTHPFEGGTLHSADELLEKATVNPLLTGVTFSGGEPFSQAKQLLPLAHAIRNKTDLEIAIYSGYTWEEIFTLGADAVELLSTADVLIDGKFVKDLRNLNLKFRGSSNQRIINVPQSLKNNKVVLETSSRWI